MVETNTKAELVAELERIWADSSVDDKWNEYDIAIEGSRALSDRQKGQMDSVFSKLNEYLSGDEREFVDELIAGINQEMKGAPLPTVKLRRRCCKTTGVFILEQQYTDEIWRPVEEVY